MAARRGALFFIRLPATCTCVLEVGYFRFVSRRKNVGRQGTVGVWAVGPPIVGAVAVRRAFHPVLITVRGCFGLLGVILLTE